MTHHAFCLRFRSVGGDCGSVGAVVTSWILCCVRGDAQTVTPVVLLVWATVPIVAVGTLAEITAERSDRAAGVLPYLGAVGNALVWLGAALLKIVVTSCLLWTGAGSRDMAALVLESAGLFAPELLGLVAMWTARGLWARANKLLRSKVERLERTLRKGVFATSIK